jgi:hypothetical protein
VHAARANELSHIFFGQIQHHLWQMFATHPPLRHRIQRVDPDWDGEYIERKPRHYPGEPSSPESATVGVGRAALVTAAIAGALHTDEVETDADFGPDLDQLEQETAERQDIPLVFVQHSHEPMGAQALVFSLLIDPEDTVRQAQMDLIAAAGVQGLDLLVNTLYPGVQDLGAPRRLPGLSGPTSARTCTSGACSSWCATTLTPISSGSSPAALVTASCRQSRGRCVRSSPSSPMRATATRRRHSAAARTPWGSPV